MKREFIPALSFRFLTRFFDFLCGIVGLGKGYRKKIVHALRLQKNLKVMDAGCGSGSLAIDIKRDNQHIVLYGIDADPQILDIARKKSKQELVDIHYKQAFLQKLPFPDCSFDVVYSSLVFHHLPSKVKEQSMKEIYRILKKGGRFLLVDFGKPKNKFFAVFSLFSLLEEGKDNYLGRIPQMLSAAGFKNVKEIARHRFNIVFIESLK